MSYNNILSVDCAVQRDLETCADRQRSGRLVRITRHGEKRSSPMTRFLPAALAGAILPAALMGAGSAAAQPDTIMEQNGVRYACTGIAESAQDPRWKRFSLKLVFATEPVGALLSGVRARIEAPGDGVVLAVRCPDSPWLMAGLAPGRYRVTASFEGRFVRSVSITVRPGRQSYVVIRFPADANR